MLCDIIELKEKSHAEDLKAVLNNKIIINRHYKDINPEVCGRESCDPGHFYGPAVRSYWLLHFVVSGKGRFTSPRGSFSPSKGDMFIIRPYEITFYEADETEPWDYIWIGFSAGVSLPSSLLESDVIYAPDMRDIFGRIDSAEDVRSNRSGCEPTLVSAVWELIGRLEQADGRAPLLPDGHVKAALNIMENEYHSGVTVEEIAARLHLNRSYFWSLFKGVMKRSPKEYLTALRMERAAELLRKRKLSVSVTAASVGYPDLFAFSRAFKNHYGISPSEYAKKP